MRHLATGAQFSEHALVIAGLRANKPLEIEGIVHRHIASIAEFGHARPVAHHLKRTQGLIQIGEDHAQR